MVIHGWVPLPNLDLNPTQMGQSPSRQPKSGRDLVSPTQEKVDGPDPFEPHPPLRFPRIFQPFDQCHSSTCRYLNAEGYEGGLKRTEVDEILSAIESNFQTWAKSFLPPAIGVDHTDAIEKLLRDLLRMRPEIALSVGRMVFMSDFRDVLEKVEVPCTIVHCTDDVVVPMTVARYMQSKIKGRVSLESVESRHYPQLTAPQLLVDILDRVLTSGNN